MRTKIKLDGIERAQAQTLPTYCSGDGVSVEVWLSFRGKEMGEGGGSGLDHAWNHPKQTVGSGFILWAGEACPRLPSVEAAHGLDSHPVPSPLPTFSAPSWFCRQGTPLVSGSPGSGWGL